MIALVFYTLYGVVAFRVMARVARAVLAAESSSYREPDTEDRIFALFLGVIAGLLWPLVAVGFVLYRAVFGAREGGAS